MSEENLIKNPEKKKIWLQTVFSVILILQLISAMAFTWNMAKEEDRSDLGLQKMLNRGEYAACAFSYNMYQSGGKTEGGEFDKFQEFSGFYDLYICGLEYQGAGASYEEAVRECIEKMNDICKNTQYPDLIPHYEYLTDSLNNSKDVVE